MNFLKKKMTSKKGNEEVCQMTITHVLKDGTVLSDITGFVVKYEDCPQVYNLINRLNQEGMKNETKDKKQDS